MYHSLTMFVKFSGILYELPQGVHYVNNNRQDIQRKKNYDPDYVQKQILESSKCLIGETTPLNKVEYSC